MLNVRRTLIYCFFLLPSSIAIAANHIASFASSEHLAIGDSVLLRTSTTAPGRAGEKLHLPNGFTMSYGEIIPMGDLYGLPDYPISQGKTENERKARFYAAFNTLGHEKKSIDETLKLLSVMHNEEAIINKALEYGENPEDVYAKIVPETNRLYNCYTGGGCAANTWWLHPGRFLKLANDNYDHFGNHAWLAYTAGHTVALEQAAAAHNSNDVRLLEFAYAVNALACHFLSDRFAAGHIRTPRTELTAHVKPSVTGSLLASYMHDEENTFGIHVHNSRGDQWISYGDRSYFTEKGAANKRIIHEIMQISADEVFSAYTSGSAQIQSSLSDLIPQADEVNNAGKQDISPLFYWDNKNNTLLRRSDLENRYDRHWTAKWWGWTTLLELKNKRGVIDSLAQARLALSNRGEQAVNTGLITEPDIIQYVLRKRSLVRTFPRFTGAYE